MKKKLIIIISCVALLLVLFLPIPSASYDDGGTREYKALTYKIVDWNVISDDGVYEKTRFYVGEEAYTSINALWYKESENVNRKFRGTIIRIEGDSVVVKPLDDEEENRTASEITFNTSGLPKIEAKVNTVVDITYKGSIAEIYPARISAIDWAVSKNLSHLEYTGEWIDKATVEKEENKFFSDIIITEIYSNCFFAQTVIPMPYTIKMNGTLDDKWCVGDQVICTYENAYYDAKSNRAEADVLTINVSDFTPDPFVCYKPVIYLYPEEETDVSVKLDLTGELTCTYPEYINGWQVRASKDGTLVGEKGMEYNYLYWEGETDVEWNFDEAFCIKGEDTAKFLEYSLKKLGLTRKEANEFIVYWLPLMKDNKYNLISFVGNEYTDKARLDISPSPDTLIRVFMVWKPVDSYVETENQILSAPERKGFTVVEWGGARAE